MKITKQEVCKVADLSMLSLTPSEIERMTKDMEKILEFADKINTVDIQDTNASAYVLPMENVFREDCLVQSMDRELLLANAPSVEKGCISVPKVIE